MAPEWYDLCDRLGLLVMERGFRRVDGRQAQVIQGWNEGTPGTRGYTKCSRNGPIRDIEDMVLRDRSHASVVMWSIGNEIEYPGDPFGHPLGRDG